MFYEAGLSGERQAEEKVYYISWFLYYINITRKGIKIVPKIQGYFFGTYFGYFHVKNIIFEPPAENEHRAYHKTTVMKRLFTILPVLALILTGCHKDPIADFSFSPDNPVAGQKVYFTNLSLDAESYEWFFGDGGTSTSYEPVYVFNNAGTFQITLRVYDSKDNMAEAYETIKITALDPTADFNITTDVPGDDGSPIPMETDLVFVGEEVSFNNTSQDAATFSWSFGDGTNTTLASPVYSYDTPGDYTVTLVADGGGDYIDSYSKTLKVVDPVSSALRITVLEYFDEYPVENASVILYQSLSDWETVNNPSEEMFTTPLGKCAFTGLLNQRYYVDVWEENHDNYQLASESVDWIETQVLEPGYIHDFIAYVDYYAPDKKMTYTRIGKKALAREIVSGKDVSQYRAAKENKFSKPR